MMKLVLLAFSALVSANALAAATLIGDSHSCGEFGARLEQRLSSAFGGAEKFCASGSAPIHWVTGRDPLKKGASIPTVVQILQHTRSNTVVVALGTNSLPDGFTDRNYALMARAIAATGKRCLWIGPPHTSRKSLEPHLEHFYQTLHASVSQYCTLIDSRESTAVGTAGNATVDGIHRTPSAGRAWADAVANKITDSHGSGHVGTEPPRERTEDQESALLNVRAQ
jgi:hypothetical protein